MADLHSAHDDKRHIRARTMSLLSSISTASQPFVRSRSDSLKARPSSTSSNSRHPSAYGCFVPTSCATSSLRLFVVGDSSSIKSEGPDTSQWNPCPSLDEIQWEQRHSVIPSISRTSSDASMLSGTSPTATVVSSGNFVSTKDVGAALQKQAAIDPILAEVERKSKFRTGFVSCATCRKQGTDYPRCGRCGEMWCSRGCRLNGDKRHSCKRTVL